MAKRSAHGAGSIRQRLDGRWEARYSLGADSGTGKQIRRSVYGETQAQVRKKLTAALRDIDNGTYQEPSRITVGKWLDIWLCDYVKDSVKPLTYAAYEKQCRVHLKPAFGAIALQSLSAQYIQSMINEKKQTLSPKTVKLIHGVLHKALQKATELRYIAYNPAAACTLPRADKKQIQPLEPAQIAAMIEAMQNEPYKNVYLVAMFTGLREGEVLGLPWEVVNFEEGTITVMQQLQRSKEKGVGQYISKTPKNGKQRKITPASFVLDVLKEEKLLQTECRLKAGAAWRNDEGLVFTNALGEPLTIAVVYKHYKKLAALIGMPNSRFHDLRHTYAVTALQEGDDIKTVQEALGHATASFTLDVYGHVSEKMKEDSKKRMDNFISGLKKA